MYRNFIPVLLLFLQNNLQFVFRFCILYFVCFFSFYRTLVEQSPNDLFTVPFILPRPYFPAKLRTRLCVVTCCIPEWQILKPVQMQSYPFFWIKEAVGRQESHWRCWCTFMTKSAFYSTFYFILRILLYCVLIILKENEEQYSTVLTVLLGKLFNKYPGYLRVLYCSALRFKISAVTSIQKHHTTIKTSIGEDTFCGIWVHRSAVLLWCGHESRNFFSCEQLRLPRVIYRCRKLFFQFLSYVCQDTYICTLTAALKKNCNKNFIKS